MVGIDSMGIYKTEETGIEKHHKKSNIIIGVIIVT